MKNGQNVVVLRFVHAHKPVSQQTYIDIQISVSSATSADVRN